MSETITLQTLDKVTTLTINRPAKRNAITQEMYGAMAAALRAYEAAPDQRAFVITGSEDYFTAGNDLQDFSMADHSAEQPPVAQFLAAISTCSKPVIAAVNGPAIGIGLTMLLHCDLVYAAESATFTAPFVKLALVPEAASSMLLAASVGMAVANDILLAGRSLSAAEAHDYGLISRVFSDATLTEEVAALAKHVARSAPEAMKLSKSLIRHQRDQVAAHMAQEADLFVAQLKSPEFSEVVSAMMQKREPSFS
ncbi:enoyl-CoA hydratase-related protein [Pseudophaeobacter flagellatus]|uniref:enoyl-CoA hydratase-related protein n=1 Tax=Pseudophaeobacter flagellatus TaxID=2899119 RepID=UPI001E3CD418|nr:enoyl-CoA hydratase-related protein [Pseudophaeobacter flagellatus]MCD9147777.1 enoyl-CoA hydratase-related protein [Pseudophaeobacter flagellatus]